MAVQLAGLFDDSKKAWDLGDQPVERPQKIKATDGRPCILFSLEKKTCCLTI